MQYNDRRYNASEYNRVAWTISLTDSLSSADSKANTPEPVKTETLTMADVIANFRFETLTLSDLRTVIASMLRGDAVFSIDSPIVIKAVGKTLFEQVNIDSWLSVKQTRSPWTSQ